MNLIEQLGGYECAKAEYDDPMYEDGELYTIKATGSRFFKHNLADELLQYRRQHNIYDAGDKVIHETYAVHEIMDISPDGFCELSNFAYVHFSKLRHATDAEIKAGKRRPELDSDTCSDIRNHVSPLTKVIDR